MLQAEPVESSDHLHPLAKRMVAIAFLNQNVPIACIWGSFGVLLTYVEKRFGVSRELSTLAGPAANLISALCAPAAGILVARYSLRLLMLIGSFLALAGMLLLAAGGSILLYIIAYGLLLGPAMAISLVLPATLVTRWFTTNAGKALGIVSMQLVVVFVPLGATWLVQTYGLAITYLVLALLPAVNIIANFFIVDWPPGVRAVTQVERDPAESPVPSRMMGMQRFLGSPRFWGLALAFIANSTATVTLLAHMVPLAKTWGFSPEHAALLLSVQSLCGSAGALVFGWLADRLGGARTLALIVFDGTVLYALLLLHPAFPAALVIIGLFGMHSSGAIPVTSLALTQAFGQTNFSRIYGLLNLINLPFGVLCVPVASFVFTRTGSYTAAIAGIVIFLGATCLLPLLGARYGMQAAAE